MNPRTSLEQTVASQLEISVWNNVWSGTYYPLSSESEWKDNSERESDIFQKQKVEDYNCYR